MSQHQKLAAFPYSVYRCQWLDDNLKYQLQEVINMDGLMTTC